MLLVTFSGLDGSGKSTHVLRTVKHLERRGYRVYTFATAHLSAAGLVTFVRHLLGRRRRVNPPSRGLFPFTRSFKGRSARAAHSQSLTDNPLQTAEHRWRNRAVLARSWIIYPFDCLVLSIWVRFVALLGYTAIVCDRYIYDKIVNLPDPDCSLQRLMLRLSPKPDLAFLLDVPPETARQRRPEHEAGYYVSRHTGYRRLLTMECGLTPVPAMTIEETQRRLESALDALPQAGTAAIAPS